MSHRSPSFIIVGAARSGTTALYNYLRQHPSVFMTRRKETNYFAFENEALDFRGPGAEFVNDSIASFSDYQSLFDEAGAETALGEASPLYLYAPQSAQRIAARFPDVKIIAVLRNPIEQAYSHYLYARRNTIEPLDDFSSAISAEDERREKHWQPMFQYSTFPRYAEQLKRYFDVFPSDQIKIFLYEELDAAPLAVMGDIFRFIGVDDSFTPDVSYRPNAGGVPKNEALQKALMRPYLGTRLLGALLPVELRRRIKDRLAGGNLQRQDMPARARAQLRERLRDDINQLEVLLGRDLRHWLD